ncbi:MAG: hypothetical protein LBL82_06260 [Oscillospiraceae bacterium]|jgi:hypothetical protein|nr:hypothetical protein [Oscillospiraceae bacterium]
MDNLSDLLGNILSDPSAMEKVMEVAAQLGLGDTGDSSADAPPPPPPPPPPHEVGSDSPQDGINADMLASLFSSFGGGNDAHSGGQSGNSSPDFDMIGMIAKFAPLIGMLGEEDDNTRLLLALRPLMSEEKRRKIDQAAKILRLLKLLPLLSESFGFGGE